MRNFGFFKFTKKTILSVAFCVSASFVFADSTHLVQKGDTLYSISRKYQITVPELRAANNLSEADVIKIGQKLIVPSADIQNAVTLSQKPVEKPAEKTSQETKTSSTVNVSAGSTYIVQKGDTVYGISKRNGITIADFLAANGMDSSSTLKLGQKVVIPSKNSGSQVALKPSSSNKKDDKKTDASKTDTKPETKPVAAAPVKENISDKKKETQNFVAVASSGVVWPLENPSVKNISGKVSGVLLTGKDYESVKVVREGTVMYTGLYRGFGQVVFVQSKTGLIYSYSGLSNVVINKGDYVVAGGEIGKTGKGKESSIKFMVFQNGKPVDPAKAPRG